MIISEEDLNKLKLKACKYMEELYEIKKCISYFDEYRFIGFHHNLLHKLQSMIDNYCEHARGSSCFSCGSVECKKCEVLFNYAE